MLNNITPKIPELISGIIDFITGLGDLPTPGLIYTAVARWVFVILSLFIVGKCIASLIRAKSPSEVWAYFNVNEQTSVPISGNLALSLRFCIYGQAPNGLNWPARADAP